MSIYNLSFFLTSTAFVDTNAIIRHTSFEIYRILAKLSFRVRPQGICFFFLLARHGLCHMAAGL